MNNGTQPKKAFITGASSGIGKAVAEELAKRGYELVLAARRTDSLSEICVEINSRGGKASFVECDVTSPDSMRNAVSFAVQNLGAINLAFLNSGVSGTKAFIELDVESARSVFEVNVFGLLNGFEALIPLMKGTGATIAAVTSLADARGFPYSSTYSASKAAASHFVEGARMELKNAGINVVTIKPGFVRSEMTDKNNFYMPFIMPADRAANIIIDGLEKGKKRIAFPWQMAIMSYCVKAMPSFIFEAMFSRWSRGL